MVFLHPMDPMMVFPCPMDSMMVFPYPMDPMDPMMVFPYPMDPMIVLLTYGSYDGPSLPYGYIPYQWPALLCLLLLSSPPALLSYSFDFALAHLFLFS